MGVHTGSRVRFVTGVAAVAVAAGGLLGWSLAKTERGGVSAGSLAFPALEAAAMTAQVQDDFIVATAPVDQGLDALCFLDTITGELRVTVLKERTFGFGSFFQYNITTDFGGGEITSPQYAMIPGWARNARAGGGGARGGNSVLYVIEATSGLAVAYHIPFNRSLHTSGKIQQGLLTPIARTSLRAPLISDE